MKNTKPSFAILILTFGVLFHANAQSWTNGLVGYFPFNGNANDESGNGHNAVVVGSGTQLTNGVNVAPNSAYRCAPGNNFIQGSGINLSNSSLSITLWFKKDYTNYNAFEHAGLVRLGLLGPAGGVTGESLHIQVNYNGAPLRFTFFNDDFDVATPVGNGHWSQITCTFDKVTRERRIYVDGSLIATNIAVRGFSGQTNFDFNPGGLLGGGFMDQVRFYNRVLTPSEVQALYVFEKNPLPFLTIAVKTVRVDMYVEIGKTYQLQLSPDLNTWNPVGIPFVATATKYSSDFDVLNGQQFFRIIEIVP
jgi:hypothetical protein